MCNIIGPSGSSDERWVSMLVYQTPISILRVRPSGLVFFLAALGGRGVVVCSDLSSCDYCADPTRAMIEPTVENASRSHQSGKPWEAS